MAGLALDRPLAKLDAAAVPISPVGTVGVGFDANDEANCRARNVGGEPVEGALERVCVDIRVDATARVEDQVTEEVGFEDRAGQGVESLQNLRYRRVEEAQQVDGRVVGDDLVDEARVLIGPRLLLVAEGELMLAHRVFPSLPDVGGELGLDVVRVGVGKLIVRAHLRRVQHGLLVLRPPVDWLRPEVP